jgi:cob(I)alamin adenosyltransferase
MKQDLTVSGFVFMLVLVGAILAAYTDQPIFWLLIGAAPVAVLHTIRTFSRRRLRRREGLLGFYERDSRENQSPGKHNPFAVRGDG